MPLHYLVLVGLLANLAGTYAYIRDTLYGRTRPNRVTYFLWSFAPFIAFVASLSAGVTWAAVPTFAAGFTPFLVLVASFYAKDGAWSLTRFDWVCGGFSVGALVLWYLTGDPTLAVALSILGDACAALPTLIKAWKRPETESGYAYLLGTLGPFTAIFAVSRYDFIELAFPIYCFGLTVLLSGITLGRKRALARKRDNV